MEVPAFQTKIDNFMMLAQSKYSMKEHHHFELFTVDYDMLVYYRHHIVRHLSICST